MIVALFKNSAKSLNQIVKAIDNKILTVKEIAEYIENNSVPDNFEDQEMLSFISSVSNHIIDGLCQIAITKESLVNILNRTSSQRGEVSDRIRKANKPKDPNNTQDNDEDDIELEEAPSYDNIRYGKIYIRNILKRNKLTDKYRIGLQNILGLIDRIGNFS